MRPATRRDALGEPALHAPFELQHACGSDLRPRGAEVVPRTFPSSQGRLRLSRRMRARCVLLRRLACGLTDLRTRGALGGEGRKVLSLPATEAT